ncbi:MAG: bifunctional hexulose-6-phosphate synthase/ribonuclease regulator [Methanobacteriota archaeon]|nr:MAG: bifunctional hexulose-6-phosphate synthase/ribonuclease regulator [Euryarchaeota archaeon]
MVVLQVALDLVQLDRAIQIAKEAVEGGVDWLEAGTPLIKSEGMRSVRELRKNFPDYEIVADMKTMDVGAAEVEMAAKAGATVVIVMGTSDDETIKDAIRAGRKYGARIMVDLLGVEDKVGRAEEVEALGVDYICHHVGVDQQMLAVTGVEDLRSICKAVGIPVAAAGGLNSETVAEVLDAGAEIIIVGGAITKAAKVTEATRIIRKAIDTRSVIKTSLFKKYGDKEIREALQKVSTPNIADAMHKKGVMLGIRPVNVPAKKLVGQALTVRCADGDWAKPVEAIDKAKKGEVIVINSGSGHMAVWGELATWSCVKKGVAGVVIDGAIRDVDTIQQLGFPAYARNISPHAGEPKGFGEIGVEIECGGQTVQNGDWIVGDESGVVVIPKARAKEVANRALDVFERENRIREEIQRGSTLGKVLELEKWEKVQG